MAEFGFLVGFLVVGFLWGYVIAWIVGRIFLKDVEPDKKAFVGGVVAVLLIFLLSATVRDSISVGIFSLPGTLLATLVLWRFYKKAWIPDDTTFD